MLLTHKDKNSFTTVYMEKDSKIEKNKRDYQAMLERRNNKSATRMI